MTLGVEDQTPPVVRVFEAADLPELGNAPVIGRGGIGVLYRDPFDSGRCIKVFSRPISAPVADRLRRLTEVIRWARPSDLSIFTSRFAWPLELYELDGEVRAYSMPLAPDSVYFELTVANRSRREPLSVKYLMDATYWTGAAIGSAKPELEWDARLDVVLDVAHCLGVLHEHGLCYGDISGNNLAVVRGQRPSAFFFDADSITTPQIRGDEPLYSPDWETPGISDPIAIDRSRFALMVLRLALEQPSVVPSESLRSTASVVLPTPVFPLVSECFASGSAEVFAELLDALRALRSDEARAAAIAEARASGYARWVVHAIGSARREDDIEPLAAAVGQVEVETEIDGATGPRYRSLIRAHRYRFSAFKLDIGPRLELRNPPESNDDLRELIFDAAFDDMISHHAVAGFGHLEGDPWLVRALERSLVEVPVLAPVVHAGTGRAEIIMSWPAETYVNTAELTVETDRGSRVISIDRPSGLNGSTLRQLNAPDGVDGTLYLRFGSRSPAGSVVLSPQAVTSALRVPAVPAPARVVKRSGTTAAAPSMAPPPSAVGMIDVFDPVEHARQIERERRERRRQRRRRIVMSAAAAVVVVIAGVVAVRVLSTPDEVEVSAFEAPLVVNVTPVGLRVELRDPPENANIAVLEVQRNDRTWEPVATRQLRRDGPVEVLNLSDVAGSVRAMRVTYRNGFGDLAAPVVWPDPAVNGFESAPQAWQRGDEYFVTWVQSAPQDDISYQTRWFDPTQRVWVTEIGERAVSDLLSIESNGRIRFGVRVLRDGEIPGPYVYAPTQPFVQN